MRIMHSLTLLGLAIALPAMAQAPAPAPQAPMQQPGHSWDKMMGRMAEKLNLTDAQKASCKDIVAKHKDNLASKGKAAREARRAFSEAVEKPESTPDTLKTLNRAAADARIEAMLEGRAMRQELRAVLTPDQREKAAYLMGRRAGMGMDRGWGGHAGMMMGGGMGQCAPAMAQK
ncbi:MAG: Spy/CpxP family protein refolding chaperone [Holophaga sp.]|nr:Spy/CpxP family protein refolding chaperone [Holophaga sp.]